MKKIILLLTVLQGILMSASLHHVNVKNVEVPLILEETHQLPAISMQITFKNSGSLTNEIKGLSGIASGVLNEGTKKLGSVKFSEKLEEKAISLSFGAGRETAVIDLHTLTDQFADGINYLNELLADPNYTQEALGKVKTKTEGKLLQKQADFDYIASVNLSRSLFKGTPLEHPSIGDPESIKKISIEDVENFVNKRFVISRAIISFGGDITLEDAKKYAKAILENLEVGSDKEIEKISVAKKREDIEVVKDTKQAYIYFGSPLNLENDEDEYIARVSAFILGSSGFGSRLMEEIRVKRGLAYSAYGRFSFNKTNCYFSGHLQTKLESQEEAEKVVREVIADFVKNGATAEELQDAQKFLMGSEPLRVETMSQRLGRSFNEYYKGHDLGWSKSQLEKIKTLDLKTLNDFIKKHTEIVDLTFSVVKK